MAKLSSLVKGLSARACILIVALNFSACAAKKPALHEHHKIRYLHMICQGPDGNKSCECPAPAVLSFNAQNGDQVVECAASR